MNTSNSIQKKPPVSNYDKWCEEWRLRFLSMDQDRLMTLLPELHPEGDYLTISHFGRRFGIHRMTGEIVSLDSSAPISRNEKLNIYALLHYVSPLARFQDRWVPFENLKNTSPFAPAFKNGVIKPFARIFDGHIDKLEMAFSRLGGTWIPYSDLGFQVNAFDCIPMRFLFWEGDEEFPAQANILFDAGATDFIHEESIVTIATVGVTRLTEEAGLKPDRSLF